MRYITAKNVRALVNDKGRQSTPEYLSTLDEVVEHLVQRACEIHNGGYKRLDGTLALMAVKALAREV